MFTTSHLHPMVVHFPIALIAIGFLAEFVFLFLKKEVYLTKMGFLLLIIGTLTATIAWFSGDLFTSEMTGKAGEIKELHQLFASITVGLLITTSVLRSAILLSKSGNTKLKIVAFLFYGLAALSVSFTGFFGGTLVYSYMMPL